MEASRGNTLRWVAEEEEAGAAVEDASRAITILGPIPAAHLGSVLPNEHLVANFASHLEKKEDSVAAVQLDSLWELRRSPFGSLHNLSMEVSQIPAVTHTVTSAMAMAAWH